MPAVQQTVEQVRALDVDKYKYGFETNIESVLAPKGLNAGTVRFISERKGEPEWMLAWRLEAFRRAGIPIPGALRLQRSRWPNRGSSRRRMLGFPSEFEENRHESNHSYT